ncbi:MAG: hypothetical protein MUE46_02690 [Xanthomonadales bacterium]|jgi:hypothetical protein|nr:hypothetical protein [Xanthomonadales bacterium]
MRMLSLSPSHVAAFARHREALELCRRFGNMARFRARGLREKLQPLGLKRCGDRHPHLGCGEFEGFVLTPPIAAADATGMSPEFAGLIVFGGVSLRRGLVHRAELKHADIPELQVGLLLQPMAALWPQFAVLLEETLAGLEAEGFECHTIEAPAEHALRRWLAEIVEADALLDAQECEDAGGSADEDDFDTVDTEDDTLEEESMDPPDWSDIEDDGDPAALADTAPGRLLLLRRLPLDRLPARCGPIVTRFFASALGPLLAIPDQHWEMLLLARETRDELGEEE